MNIVLGVDPIRPPLTGIGRYAWELATRLRHAEAITSLRFASATGWVPDPNELLQQSDTMAAARQRLGESRLVRGLYRIATAVLQPLKFRGCDDALYHGPSFSIPRFPGKSVATIHDLSVLRFPLFHPPARAAYFKREIENTLQRADFLISDSEFVRQEVISTLGWPEARIRAIHLGCSASFRPCEPQVAQPVLSRWGLTFGAYSLCVATIEPRKNISTLIHAYAALPATLRSRYPLVLAGDKGWHSEDIHALIDQASRAGWLTYLGYVPEAELPLLFAGARGFIYPSLYEGFGLPVIEAMASGVPIVTSSVSSLPEITQGAALLMQPENTEELTAAIHRMLEDDVWRGGAIAKSLQIAPRYTWSQTVAQTVETYRATMPS